ncbi:MAG: TIR domain-containing protein [Atopobiaceae bacterium]|nr:TIR domain-containing protein [Atopobiaceae bacterium]
MICTICKSTIDDEAAFCPFCGQAVPGGPSYDDYDYEAFISYRHLERDRKVAVRLQRKLEGMHIPRGVTPADGRRRLGKLFRDEDELPTATSLPDQIREALKRSPYLVVVCSPQTNESRWVRHEVELFASLHGRERIRIALAAGEPNESFPPLVLSRLALNEAGEVVSVEEEPIAADFRSDALKDFNRESMRIAATLIGCGFDELRQRLHARKMRRVAIGASAVAAISLAFGSFSLWQQHQIEKNYHQAQVNESEALAVESQELLAAGDRMEAIQVALAALPTSAASTDRPFVPAAQIALAQATQVYPAETYWRSCYAVDDVKYHYAVSEGGLQAFYKADGSLEIVSLATGTTVSTIDLARELSSTGEPDFEIEPDCLQFCGERLLCASVHSHSLALFDSQTGTALWKLTDFAPDGASWGGGHFAVSPDGSLVALGTFKLNKDSQDQEVLVHLIDTTTGEVGEPLHLSLTPRTEPEGFGHAVRVAFSPDSSSLAAACLGSIWRVDLATGDTRTADTSQAGAYELSFLDHSIVCISGKASSPLSVSLGTAYFDVYSSELEPLWSRAETPPTYYDNTGVFHTSYAYVVGESKGSNVVYVTGSEVKFVDTDGNDVMTVKAGAPLRGCLITPYNALATLDIEGSLLIQTINEKSGDTVALSQMDVAKGEYGSLHYLDDVPYAMVWDTDAATYRIYRMLRLASDIPNVEPHKEFESLTVDAVYQPTFQDGRRGDSCYLVAHSAEGFSILGQDSLEPLWTKSYEELGVTSNTGWSLADNLMILYTENDENGIFTITELSLDTGEVVARHEVSRKESGWVAIKGVGVCQVGQKQALHVSVFGRTDDGGTAYMVHYLDRDTLDELLAIGPFEKNMQSLYHTNTTAIAIFDQDGRGRMQLFSLSDGSHLEGRAAEELLLPSTNQTDRELCFNSDSSRLAAVCADGNVCCLDTETWDVLWEQPVSNLRTIAFSPDGEHLLVQDNAGMLLMLSSSTGQILRSSSVRLPLISGLMYPKGDAQQLHALCLSLGLERPSTSYAVISLEEDSFGPLSCVHSGMFYVAAQNRVLVRDPLLGDCASVPLYTLDELIELADTTIEGHELSEAKLYRYRIN